MIIVDNGHTRGVSIFFPGILANGRTFKVVDLAWEKRYALPRIIFHIALITAIVLGSNNAEFMNVCGMLMLCYVVVYLSLVKRVPVNVASERVTYSLAPAKVWIAHFSCFGMLFLFLLLTTKFLTKPHNPSTFFATLIALVVGLFLIAPIWSYSIYVRHTKGPH